MSTRHGKGCPPIVSVIATYGGMTATTCTHKKEIWGPPSESQLEEGLNIILYEALMLAFTADLLNRTRSILDLDPFLNDQRDTNKGLRNASLESL